MIGRSLVALVALAALPGGPAVAQVGSRDDGPKLPAIVAAGVGTLELAPGDQRALPWSQSDLGPLVALEPIVARLGGELDPGPFGQSYGLALGDVTATIAPGSSALTFGTEIVALSQPPQVIERSLRVPVDLLVRTYGDQLGVTFEWHDAEHRLAVLRPPTREIPVQASLVHLQGITTVVLEFPEPVRYRIRRIGSTYEIAVAGARLLPPPARPRDADPYLRSLVVAGSTVRLELAPGAAAESYALDRPFRLVFDIYREADRLTASAAVEPEPAARSGRIETVVLDPGHGGKETGAIGPSGTAEKDLTLAIALALAERLRAVVGLEVVLTRSEDVHLELDERTALANQHQADLFLSIHLNSSLGRSAHGAETYFLSLQASDARAAEAAATENAAFTPDAERDLELVLWDLAQTQHLAASQTLATLIQQELNRTLDLRDRGVKQAPFRVLMGATMPAVLVELGFISTPAEEQKLRDPAYRAELVAALVTALRDYRGDLADDAEDPDREAPVP